MKIIKRYLFFILTIGITLIIYSINIEVGTKAIKTIAFSLREMILIIPPIFILLGLLDIWVPKEMMIKYMGKESGIKGIVLSIFIGSAAAGPLYGAFPVAVILMKKGAKFSNVLLFLGAWSTTKIPMVLFEVGALGVRFAITRLVLSLIGIFIIAYVVEKSMNENEIEVLYENARAINE